MRSFFTHTYRDTTAYHAYVYAQASQSHKVSNVIQFKFKMIGFSEDLKLFRKDNLEGMETKNLQKHELYEIVSTKYVLPPVASKGITRDYLLQVKDGDVFRVTNEDHKHFEYRLTKSMIKKVGIINNALLVKKLNLLLRDRGERELGYTEYDLPEQNWLYKAARYIDRSNLLEFFETPASPEPPLHEGSSLIANIHYGRVYASDWLFRLDKAKKNKKLWESFTLIAEKYRMLCSFKVNKDVLEHDLKQTKEKIGLMESDLQDLVGKISFTYTAIENPQITPDVVIENGTGLTKEMSGQLKTNASL